MHVAHGSVLSQQGPQFLLQHIGSSHRVQGGRQERPTQLEMEREIHGSLIQTQLSTIKLIQLGKSFAFVVIFFTGLIVVLEFLDSTPG